MSKKSKEPFKLNSKTEYNIVQTDLEQLRNSTAFINAILACKGKPGGNVQGLCYRFLIGDPEWMSHVIQFWDGNSPLPRTDDSSIWRSALHKPRNGDCDPLPLGLDQDNFFSTLEGFHGGESDYLSGSPRLRKQSLYQRDASGAEWMTLRIRLAPGFTEEQLAHWARGALKDCRSKSKKPSSEALVMQILDRKFKDHRSRPSVGQIQRFLTGEKCQAELQEHGFSLRSDRARKYGQQWLRR